MPELRKSTRRFEKASEVQREQTLQTPGEPQQPPHRPRTRAWAKEEEQRKEEVLGTSSTAKLRPRKALPEQPSLPRHARGSPQARPKTSLPSVPLPFQATHRPPKGTRQHKTEKGKVSKASHQEGGKRPLRQVHVTRNIIEDFPLRQSRVPPPRRPVLSTWLDQLQSTSPVDSRALPLVNNVTLSGCPTSSDHSMESSSSASRTSQGLSEGGSTAKASQPPNKDKKLNWDKIRLRRIRDTGVEDEKSEHFKSILNVKPFRIRFKDTTDLQSILRELLQRCEKARPNDDSYAAIEKFSNQFNGWRPGVNLASITNREFDVDINYCKKSNEAVLQRTVMTSIIDRWHLHELFVYNCEGQWYLPKIFRLPTRSRGDEVTLPKPDLAVSFTLEAFTGADTSSPFPKDIGSCMRPDGGVGRCFPFLFMEVKRAGHDLEPASMANLHSASQALFNIYIWMSQAGHQESFFDSVRVFSFVLNAQEISMRVHRAVLLPSTNSLSYLFEDIVSITGYSRDQACLLFKNVLIEYGKKELYGILKSTFEEVSRQEDESKEMEDGLLQGKRKSDGPPNASSKKVRSVQGTAESPVDATSSLDATSSFGASGLEIA